MMAERTCKMKGKVSPGEHLFWTVHFHIFAHAPANFRFQVVGINTPSGAELQCMQNIAEKEELWMASRHS